MEVDEALKAALMPFNIQNKKISILLPLFLEFVKNAQKVQQGASPRQFTNKNKFMDVNE